MFDQGSSPMKHLATAAALTLSALWIAPAFAYDKPPVKPGHGGGSSSGGSPTSVPEPASMLLLGGGVAALVVARKRRRKN